MNVFEYICPACKAFYNDIIENGTSKLLHMGLSSSKDKSPLPTLKCIPSHDYVVFQKCGHCCPEVFEECRACKLGYEGKLDIPGHPTTETCYCHYALKNSDPLLETILIQKNKSDKKAPLKAFISYSKFDGEKNPDGINYLEEFKQSMIPLGPNYNNLLETWDDTYLIAGEDWDNKIKQQLDSCDVIFLLVSRHFLNTRYIVGVELEGAIKRQQQGECIVVPIIIKACAWEDIQLLKNLNAIPRKGDKVDAWKNNINWTSREDAWLHVYEEVKKMINKFI